METNNTPEINGTETLVELKAMFDRGHANLQHVAPGKPRVEELTRLNAIAERMRRLYHTEQAIAQGNAALRKNR